MNDDERDLHDLMLMVALDALSGEEHERAKAMIERDPELRNELDELRTALAGLHDDASVTPPPALRASVLAAIADVDQDDPATTDVSARPTAVAGDVRSIPSSPAPSRRRSGSGLLGLSAAAAVCALVAGLVAWFALGRSDTGNRIADVVDDSGAETVELRGELRGLRLTYVPGTDDAVIHGEGIDDPGDERAYQLWFIDGDAPVPSEVFQPDADGEVEALVEEFNGGESGYAVTIEPASGSEAPTTPVAASTR